MKAWGEYAEKKGGTKVNLKKLQLNGMELVDPNADYSGDQVIYLDFKGANNVAYNNDALNIHVNGTNVADSGLDQTHINKIITELNTTYANTGVTFTVTAPIEKEYSTIHIGNAGSAFAQYGSFLGLSETIDTGNQIKSDEAFVFSDKITSTDQLADIIAHEAGHLLGYEHKEINQTSTSGGNSLADFAASLDLGSSYGVTIITHGFNGDAGWLYGMAKAVQENIVDGYSLKNEDAPIYKIAVTALIEDGFTSSLTVRLTEYSSGNEVTWDSIKATHPILILDWTDVDGWPLLYSTQQIASVVTTALLNNNNNLLSAPIHLIGHSRGGSLIGSLAEDLGQKGIWVDQTTFLDPHPTMNANPFNNDWGQNTGMTVPWNVVFADNYYQVGGVSWPNGGDVYGATSIELQDPVLYNGSATEGYGMFGGGAHSDVHLWYHGTIPKDISDGFSDGQETITGTGTEASTWYLSGNFVATSVDVAFDRETMGYYYSLVEGGTRPGSGLSTSFGGDVVRGGAIESNNGWANIGYITNNDIGKTSYTVEDTLNLSYYYDSYNDSNATISFFLDDDCNPYNNDNNNKVTSIGDPFSVSFSGTTKRETSLSFTSNNVGQNQYVLAKISTTIGNVRYSYMPGTIDIANNLIQNTILNNGNIQQIYFGQLAVNTTINSDGCQIVYSGGVAKSTIINGGSQFISSGAMATNTTINSSGGQTVYYGGVANYTSINSGGWQYVCSGGTTNNTIVKRGSGLCAFQDVLSGGTANYTTLSGESFTKYVSGVQYDTVYCAVQTVSSGGVANSTTVNFGGCQIVSSGGVANSTKLNDWGFVSSGGVANSTTINSGGWQSVDSGGVANSTTINFGGSQSVSGTATRTIINGGVQNVNGTTTSTTINGGSQTVIAGGLASKTIVNSGGSLIVNYGGSAISFAVSSGGVLRWDFNTFISGTSNGIVIPAIGGTTSYNLFLGCNHQYIDSGYIANSTTIDFACKQYVSSGGVANYTTINSGGNQYISSGGVANYTTISGALANNSGGYNFYQGYQFISSGGVADSTSIDSFGTQYVEAHGTASNTTVNAGGSMYVQSDGIVSGALTMAGGHVVMINVASVSNLTTLSYILATAKTNDLLISTVNVFGGHIGTFGSDNTCYSLNLNNAAKGSYSLLDGHSLPDGKIFSVTNNSQTVNVTVGSSYTFSDGYTLSLGYDWFQYSNRLTATFTDITPPSTPAGLKQTITNNNALFNWEDSKDASGIKQYELQVDNNSDFSSPEYSASSVVGESSINGLRDGIYYWKVRTQDNSGNYSAWSSGSNFTVDITAPSVPATLTRTVTGSSVALDWADSTDATSGVKQYEYQIDNNSDFLSNEKSGTVASSDANATGLTDGTYYWKVRTVDNSGNYSVWTTGSSFTVDTTAPIVPAALTRTVTGNSVALDWADAVDAASGVKQYEYQIDNNSDFLSNEKSGTVASSDANATGLTDGSYYWRIRTQDNSGNYSAWTTGSNFTVDITAPAPSILVSTVTGNNVALDWADSTDVPSGVKQYEVQIDKHADFSSQEYSLSPVASTGTISNLTDGTFYWRVRTQDNAGNYSTWSSGGSFMVDVTAPSAPATLTRTVTGNSIVLDWADALDATSGVKQYEIQVDNNSNFSSPEYSATSVVSNATAAGLADGTYFWKVRTQDNSGNYSAWSSGSNFTVDITAPSVPATLTRTVIGSSVALDWADGTDATSGVKQYEFQIDNNSDFSSNEKSGTTVISNASATGLTDGNYYWRVRTQDNSGNYSAWVSGSSFMVDISAPSVPASLTPIVTGNNVIFDWANSTDAPSGVKQYQVQLDKHADFSSPEYSATPVTSNASATGLADGNYYWRVNTQDNAGNTSAWSNGTSFVSDVGGTISGAFLLSSPSTTGWVGLNDPADYYKLVMANNGTLNLNLTGLSGDANLSLMDSKGKILKTSAAKGNANENINNLLLTSGTYYVNVAPVKGVNSAAYTLTHAETYFPADTVGNTLATAGVLETNGSADEWVGFGDPADYYKLTLDSAGTLSLNLTGLSGDVNMTLYDAKGKSLKSSSVKGLADENIANLSLAGGDYYVKVASASGVNDASYKLSNVVDYFPTDTVGNTQTNARILDVNGFSDEWVGFGDPADYYKLTLDSAGKLSLNLADLTGDANMTLYDAKGKSLKSSSVKGLADENIANLSLAGGDYYVKVAPASGVTDAAYSLSNTVDYFPADTAGNTFALAQPITESGPVNEWLGFGDKDDYYMFELQASTAVTLDLTDMTSNVNLYLYDSKNKQLAASAKSGNTDESITKTLAAGKYYVKATLVGKDNTDYSLNFGIDPDAFKVGSLKLSSAASPLSGSTDTGLTGDPLKKNNGLLAS